MRYVNFTYVDSGRIGYGRMGSELVKALDRALVKNLGPLDGTEDEMANVACWASYPSHAKGWYEGQFASCLTMWEATRLPDAYREQMDEFDMIVVPSEQNVELFSKHHPCVRKIRLGVDPEVWHYEPRDAAGQEFVFLTAGSGSRKGGDLVAKAYKRLWAKEGSWGSGPTPVVWFKSPTGRVDFTDYNGVVQDVPLIQSRMKIIAGRMSAEDEVDLYRSAHCFVAPSRGEGFGLQPLQAIAQGIPTVLTDAHGHEEFAHLGLTVEAKRVPAGYFMLGDAGEWWEPNLDELTDQMAWVYNNYTPTCLRARSNSTMVSLHWTWAHAAEDWIDVHEEETDLGLYGGDGDWHYPHQLGEVFVQFNIPWQVNIAGTQYDFEPGVGYMEPAEVKRIAFERTGLLHPDCLDTDGLTDVQAAQVGVRRAENAYCPSCGTRLNSGRTKADDIADGIYIP